MQGGIKHFSFAQLSYSYHAGMYNTISLPSIICEVPVSRLGKKNFSVGNLSSMYCEDVWRGFTNIMLSLHVKIYSTDNVKSVLDI